MAGVRVFFRRASSAARAAAAAAGRAAAAGSLVPGLFFWLLFGTSLGFLSRALPVAGIVKNMAAGCLVVWLAAALFCQLPWGAQLGVNYGETREA